MPSSLPIMMYPIVEAMYMASPNEILDIGIGYGKYGLLAREYLSEYGKPKRVDGIEVFEPYITDIQRAIYDKIYIGNVMDIDFGDYDLILLIDVIEHLKKEDGVELLKRIYKHCKYFVVSTPLGYVKQDETRGNKYEEHLSGWDYPDFQEYFEIKNWGNTAQFCLLLKGELLRL